MANMKMQTFVAHHKPLAAVVAIIALACVSVYPLMTEIGPFEVGSGIVFSTWGAMGAGVELLSIWIVFSQKPFLVRWLIGMGVCLLIVGLWFLGFNLSIVFNRPPVFAVLEQGIGVSSLLCMPLFVLGIQVPLWLFRFVCRWSILTTDSSNESFHVRPLTIRDFLEGTAVIAVAISSAILAAQLAVKNGFPQGINGFPQGIQATTFLCLAFAVCSGLSLITSIPIVGTALRPRKPAFSIYGIIVYNVIALTTCGGIVFTFPRSVPRWAGLLNISFMLIVFIVSVAVPLLAARHNGSRLIWGRESSRHAYPL